MTEEIIIDGVNVAGCIRFNKDTGYCKGAFKPEEEPYCQCFTCEYKQLKRLEQENKELKAYKDVNEDFKKAWDELNKKYTEVLKPAKENADSNEYCLQELEKKNFALTQESQQKSNTICELGQENKELKEEIQFHNKENSNLLAERNAAQIGYDEIREVREYYRSALEEIKTILDKECGVVSNAKVVGIINEVIGE